MLRYLSKLPSLTRRIVGGLQKQLSTVFECEIAPFGGLCCVF